MIFNSIRWRLQIWYGVILIAVLAGFGFTAYQLESGRLFRRIDDELHRRVNALANVFNLPPRGRGPDEAAFEPFDGPPPESARPPRPRPPPRPDRPLDNDDGPRGLLRPRWEFQLPPGIARLFDDSDTNGFYYVVWTEDGKELSRSTNAPAEVSMFSTGQYRATTVGRNFSTPVNTLPRPGEPPREPPPSRMRGAFREMSVFKRPGEVFLVGRSIVMEIDELHRVAWVLTVVGGTILLLGLAGGWWMTSRAIRPIEDISATAVKISAGDLSQRISVADTENELGRLADVLNSTFARLEAAFGQQQQFTSDAAHELRTPVSVMLTQTQTALSRERSVAEYRETVEACQRAAQRMRRLIESLLELARLDAGQEAMKRAGFDLSRTAADCIELVRPLAVQRGITISTDLTGAECQGDAERLAQVITNLITNAIHYNKDGGEVRVATRREQDFVVLEVSDTGMGIAPEHLPHVFDRFYRADSARTTSQGRAGLGLAISKAIVEAHGGSIEVLAQLGTGTTFKVRLPAG